MREIMNGIAVTVGSTAILGLVAWVTGFWGKLGTFELRTVFGTAVLGLAFGLGAIFAVLFRPMEQLRLSPDDIFFGDQVDAAQVGNSLSKASPKCSDHSKAIGIFCNVTRGGGNLQDVGVMDSANAECVWRGAEPNEKGDPFAATGKAVCVRVSNP
jgi:hypothetical protein